jgi:SulP family sulfate permease
MAPVIAKIPVAALVGLMFLVSLNTFNWGSLWLINKIAWTDTLVIVAVTVVTIWKDLAIAVAAGVFIGALSFAWSSLKLVRLQEEPDGEKRIFRLKGPLFFGSAMSFQTRLSAERIHEEQVLIDFSEGAILDHSAMHAIAMANQRLYEAGKKVELRALPDHVRDYLEWTSDADAPVKVSYEPEKAVDRDALILRGRTAGDLGMFAKEAS